MNVAYQGLAGAYSEAATIALFPQDTPVPCRTFGEVFASLGSGAVGAAVDAGKITQAQADQLTPKVDDMIAKIVDHKGSPKPDGAKSTTTTKPTPKPTN